MSSTMDRGQRVEAARQWFEDADGSLGSLSWDDVDLVAQLGVADEKVAHHLLLTAPDGLFSQWATLQRLFVVASNAPNGAGSTSGTRPASAEGRLKLLTTWHTDALAKGRDGDLAGLGTGDLSRIASSGATTSAELRALVALAAPSVVLAHSDEIAAVLSGQSVDELTGELRMLIPVPHATTTAVTAPREVAEPPKHTTPPRVTEPTTVAEPMTVTEARGVAAPPSQGDLEGSQTDWTDFASFDYAAAADNAAAAGQGSAPPSITFTVTDDEHIEMTWPDEDRGAGVVLYRVTTSDEYAPTASTDLGDLIAVTTQRGAVDARGFDVPVRHVAVWANRGRTEAEARRAQPTLVAADGCVLPVRRCELRVEDDGTVIGRWEPANGVVRVDVLRLKSRVANQTSLYDPNYRLGTDQVGLDGFTDRDADPGEEFEYRIYVVAQVEGDSEEMSEPVVRRVRVRAVVHPVNDLRVTPTQGRQNGFDLRWTTPPYGDVEIYRTERRPTAGLGQELISRAALVRAQLSANDKLLNRREWPAGEGLMRDVTWPVDWARAYFTPVTVLDEQQIRVGQTQIMTRADPPTEVRLVERVDSQFLTFAWPSGMTSVRIFTGPRDVDLVSAATQQPIMELSEEDYRKYGGAHLRDTLPVAGCAVHLVGTTYSQGRAELSAPTTIQYAGLARVSYRIETPPTDRGRFGRKAPTRPPRLMARCDAPITNLALVLTHHPNRLPLFITDGVELTRAIVSFEVGAEAVVLGDVSSRPSVGFIRLFADVPPNEGHPIAVLDPSVDQLRCG